jgi:ketopantoate reductase
MPINHHKVSLLQDFERGLPMEWGEVALAARAFAEAAQLDLPSFQAIANLATFKVLEKGLLPSAEAWGYDNAASPQAAKAHA